MKKQMLFALQAFGAAGVLLPNEDNKNHNVNKMTFNADTINIFMGDTDTVNVCMWDAAT